VNWRPSTNAIVSFTAYCCPHLHKQQEDMDFDPLGDLVVDEVPVDVGR
jgi:hypothetical protein